MRFNRVPYPFRSGDMRSPAAEHARTAGLRRLDVSSCFDSVSGPKVMKSLFKFPLLVSEAMCTAYHCATMQCGMSRALRDSPPLKALSCARTRARSNCCAA